MAALGEPSRGHSDKLRLDCVLSDCCMTPSVHAAVSFLAARGLRLSLPALVIGGLAPDVDFVLLPFAGFNTWHRVLTHNIFFVLVLAAALALFSGKNRGRYFAAALI